MLGTSPAESLASVLAKPMPLVTSTSTPLTERLVEYAVPQGEIKVAGEAPRLWRPSGAVGASAFDPDLGKLAVTTRPDFR